MSLAMKTARRTTNMGAQGGFLSSIGGFVKGAVGGLLTGGPVGAITGGISSFLPKQPQQVPQLPGINPPFGGPPGVGIGSGTGGTRISFGEPTVSGIPPKGYRLNKSSYFLKDGTFVPKGSRYVKIRRRNSMNVRALDRAISRIDGAKRIQSKLHEITTAKYTAAGNKRCAA